MSKNKIHIIATIILFAFFLSFYLIFTTRGSAFIIKLILSKATRYKNINIVKIRGNLVQGVTLEGVELEGIRGLPEDSDVKIQRLNARLTFLSPEGLNIELFNGRLNLVKTEQILFQGNYKRNTLDFNAYSSKINISYILSLFNEDLKDISGELTDLDIYIEGQLTKPKFNGKFKIDTVSYKGFSAVDCPVVLDVNLENIQKVPRVLGEVVFKSGRISGPKTAIVHLENSKVIFSGDPTQPKLAIRGNSKVGKYKIDIVLKGEIDKPELKLTSQPEASQERLLAMLVTAEAFSGIEESLEKKEISPDLARDFVDYFFFGGAGRKLSERFGIDVSVRYDSNSQGIDIKKSITSKAGLTYSAEQPRTETKEAPIKQKVAGEYEIIDSISIGVEKELEQKKDKEAGGAKEQPETEESIYLKFKKEF